VRLYFREVAGSQGGRAELEVRHRSIPLPARVGRVRPRQTLGDGETVAKGGRPVLRLIHHHQRPIEMQAGCVAAQAVMGRQEIGAGIT